MEDRLGIRWSIAFLWVTLVCICIGGPVSAQSEADKEARKLYQRGDDHYQAGRYDQAAEDFNRAYELSRRPALLYNLANAYERAEEFGKAAEALRRYLNLATLTSKKRQRYLERVRKLERKADDKAEREELMRQLAEERRRRKEQESGGGGGDASASGPSRMPAYLFLAGGGVGLAGWVGLGLAARSAGDDASGQCRNGLCMPGAEDSLDRERNLSILADVSLVLGLASAGIGAYLLVTGSADEDGEGAEDQRRAQVAPTFWPGGIGIGVAGEF